VSTCQRILIVDDHPLFRTGLTQLIEMASDELELVGQASSGEEGIKLAKELRPDMILLDLNMKGTSGIEVLKEVKSDNENCRIIMVTVSDAAEDLVDALRSGADGYLLKDMEPPDLLASIKNAAQGQTVLSDKLTGLLVQAVREDSRPKNPEEAGLTEQERRVLEHIAAGKSNKLIARALNISDGTVKVHVKHILKKLNLNTRVEAAVWAIGKQDSRAQDPGKPSA
jgi:two-component system nitrate/nitrite response regulator NarL